MQTRYRFDINDRRRLQHRLGENGKAVEKAMRWTLDAVQRKAATMISRDIRGTYAIKQSDVKKTLRIDRGRRDARRALLYTGRRLPLEKFSPKGKTVRVEATSSRGKPYRTKRRGVTVRVRKDHGRQLVGRAGGQSGGWHAKGHILRRSDASNSRSEPRMQFGPSIPGMVAHPSVINDAQEMVREELPREFSGRMDYLLGQMK